MSPDETPLYLEALAPGTRVGRWRVVERLGVGGQGAVYRVEDVDHPGAFYALKLARYMRDGRAAREVEVLMRQRAHPHVVGFHGWARWPHPRTGGVGFVMDWVPGRALDTWAETEGTTFRQLAEVGATVASTLGDLHARGVLHRDLKPEHILVREADGQPVLLDFGAGWYEGATPLTTGPLPPATLGLLSPEAVRFLWRSAEHPEARYVFRPTDDLYALGVCLYRAATGHDPFGEGLPMDLLQWAIVHVRPVAPALVNPRVPEALNDVIVRLLSKDPAARYPSGAALHAALSEAVHAGAAWDASLFEWEEVASSEGKASERRLRRPPRPKPSWTAPVPASERRMAWRPGPLGVALAAAVLLALVFMPRRPPAVPDVSVTDESWATDLRVEQGTAQDPLPSPLREQKRAPCVERVEVEMSGACWHSLEQRPPTCPRLTVAYKGRCFLPVLVSPVPTSIDGGWPDGR